MYPQSPELRVDVYKVRTNECSLQLDHYDAWYADAPRGDRYHGRGKTEAQALLGLRKTLRQNGIPLTNLPRPGRGKTYYS